MICRVFDCVGVGIGHPNFVGASTDLKDTFTTIYCEFEEGNATKGNANRDVHVKFTQGHMTRRTLVVPIEVREPYCKIQPEKASGGHPASQNRLAVSSVCLCWVCGQLGSNIQCECCSFGKYPSLRKVHDHKMTFLGANSGPSSSLSKIYFADEYPPDLYRNSLRISVGIRPKILIWNLQKSLVS